MAYQDGTSDNGSVLGPYNTKITATSQLPIMPQIATKFASSAPSYTYGTSTSGSYTDTFTSNNVYHVSTAASYVSSLTADKLATGAPSYTYGSSTSGSYSDTWTSNNVYHVSTSSSYVSGSGNSLKYPTNAVDDATVGTKPWASLTLIYSSNDLRAYAVGDTGVTAYTHYARTYAYGFAVSGNIDGIKLEVERKTNDATNDKTYDYSVRLYSGGYKGSDKAATSTTWTTSDVFAIYGGSNILWDTTWTAAEINNSGFGASLSARIVSNPGWTGDARIDCMRITVYYSTVSYRIDFYYVFQFTEGARADVTSLSWNAEGKISAGTLAIYIYNVGTSAWVDTSQTWTTSEATKSGSVDKNTYMHADGRMWIRFYLTGASASFTVSADYLYWHVVYDKTYYRCDFYYGFQFTEGARADVTALSWNAEGKVSAGTLGIYIYNHGGSAWVDTGQTWGTSEATKSASVDKNIYMSSTGYMYIRFYLTGASASFTISADDLHWTVSYSRSVETRNDFTRIYNNGSATYRVRIEYGSAPSGLANWETLNVSLCTTMTDGSVEKQVAVKSGSLIQNSGNYVSIAADATLYVRLEIRVYSAVTRELDLYLRVLPQTADSPFVLATFIITTIGT